MLSVIGDVLLPAVLLGPPATGSSTEQVHAVMTFTTVAEALIQTRRPVEVKPEERRYRRQADAGVFPSFTACSWLHGDNLRSSLK